MNMMRVRFAVAMMALSLLGCASAAVPATPTSTPTPQPTDTPQPTATPTPNPMAAYVELEEGWTVAAETSTLTDMQGFGTYIFEDGVASAWQAEFDIENYDDVQVWLTILNYEDDERAASAYDQYVDMATASGVAVIDSAINGSEGLYYWDDRDTVSEHISVDHGCSFVILIQEIGSYADLYDASYFSAMLLTHVGATQNAMEDLC
jgi:hypothetical protein